MGFGVGIHKADGQPGGPGTPGAADAVGVVVGAAGQVKVDHHRQVCNVQPASGHVGGHHHFHAAEFEVGQHLRAFALAQAAMKRFGADACLAQFFGHGVGRMLRGHKHQHPAPAFACQQVAQQLGASGGIHSNGTLGDVGRHLGWQLHADANRVVQQLLSHGLDRAVERGRKQQVLALGRQQGRNGCPLVTKGLVEHAVGFVQHQGAHAAQRQGVVVGQVQQAARGGHHHVGATAQAHHLRVDGHAAKHHSHFHRLCQPVGHVTQGGAYLNGQLARGH